MKMIHLSLAAATLSLLAGCSTSYSSRGWMGGFSETQLDENVWTIRFQGNGYTGDDKASDYCLLRCAEVSLGNGFNYFVIVDENEWNDVTPYTTGGTSYSTGTGSIHGNSISTTTTTHTTPGQTFLIRKPTSENTIVCFTEKPNVNGLVYSAEFLRKSISEKYGMSEDELE